MAAHCNALVYLLSSLLFFYLLQHVNAKVKENLRLAPESLLQIVPDMGLIIDLTNTNRYYHPSAITNHDVLHQKLMIPGKQTPSHKLAQR